MRPVQGMKRTRDHLNSIDIVVLGTCQLLLHTWVCGGGCERRIGCRLGPQCLGPMARRLLSHCLAAESGSGRDRRRAWVCTEGCCGDSAGVRCRACLLLLPWSRHLAVVAVQGHAAGNQVLPHLSCASPRGHFFALLHDCRQLAAMKLQRASHCRKQLQPGGRAGAVAGSALFELAILAATSGQHADATAGQAGQAKASCTARLPCQGNLLGVVAQRRLLRVRQLQQPCCGVDQHGLREA